MAAEVGKISFRERYTKWQFLKKGGQATVFKAWDTEKKMWVVIKEMKIAGDYNSLKDIGVLEELLTGTIHDPETLRIRLSEISLPEFIPGLENEELLAGMF